MKYKQVILKNFIGKSIWVIIGVLLGIFIFIDIFNIEVYKLAIVFFTIFTVNLFMIIYSIKNRKVKRVVLAILIICTLCLIYFLRKNLYYGIINVANRVIKEYNNYYNINKYEFLFPKNTTPLKLKWGNTLLFMAITVEYAFILVTASYYKIHGKIHIGILGIFTVIGLMVGKVPSNLITSVMVIYILLCVVFNKNTKIIYNKLPYLIIMCVLSLAAANVIINSSVFNEEKKINNLKQSVEKVADKLNINQGIKNLLGSESDVAGGGISEGALGTVDKIKYTGEKKLNIQVASTNNYVYIKAFIGNTYSVKKWYDASSDYTKVYNNYNEKLNAGDLEDAYDVIDFNWYTADTIFNKAYNYFMINDPQVVSDYIRSISINDLGNEKKFNYYMYNLADDNIKSDDGVYPISDNNFQYDYSYLDLPYDEILNGYKLTEDNEIYESVCLAASRRVPDYLIKLFNEILENPPYYTEVENISYNENIQRCIEYVKNYLYSNTQYTRKPGKLKDGRDYITDFLVNKKKGYCTAYASAGTMMFRYLGIPARYVEGYAISPSNIKAGEYLGENKYSVDVLDDCAHAWVEIYVKGLGFIPVDVTPGYGSLGEDEENNINKDENNDNTSENITSNSQFTSDDSENHNSSTTNNSEKNNQDNATDILKDNLNINKENKKNNNVIMIVILIVIGNIALVGLIVYFRNKQNNNYYLKKNKKVNDIKKAMIISKSNELFKKLKKYNIYYDKDTFILDCARKMEKLVIVNGEISAEEFINLYNKAMYSSENDKISYDEFKKVSKYVDKYKNCLHYRKNKV